MERKKEERKENILKAVEVLIAEHGYKSMTMDQVASAADVAKGTLYLYFKNKSTLCAAVNARINRELNDLIKDKMDSSPSGSEKIVAAGAAIIEFSNKNHQKWKAGSELIQMKYKDMDDPNVQDSLQQANLAVHMLADAYRKGKDEGSILDDIDPIPSAIYNRMAFINAFTSTSEQKSLLKLNNISPDHYLSVSWNLINRSTHIKPSIRDESDKPLNEQRSKEDISNEISSLVKSLDLPVDNAPQVVDAWKKISEIIMGNLEYDTQEELDHRVVNHITKCPASVKGSKELTRENVVKGCQRYCKILVNTLNPEYTQKFIKMMCAGDDYCESIVEIK